MIETWEAVPGYEGIYEVSDHGRVRSLDREVTHSDGVVGSYSGRMLKSYISSKGYESLCLSANGRARTRRVHCLVALAFMGPRPEGLEVCHSDGNPLNNCLDNLRYDTPESNGEDRVAHGTQIRGEQHPSAALNEAQVLLIRRLKGKRCNAALAKAWGISPQTLGLAQHGKRWSHLK